MKNNEIKTLIINKLEELKGIFPEISPPKIVFLNREAKDSNRMLADTEKHVITVYAESYRLSTENNIISDLIHELSHLVFCKICETKGLVNYDDFPHACAKIGKNNLKSDLRELFYYVDEVGAELTAEIKCRNKIDYSRHCLKEYYEALIDMNESIKSRIEDKQNRKTYLYVNDETINLFNNAQKTIEFLQKLIKSNNNKLNLLE